MHQPAALSQLHPPAPNRTAGNYTPGVLLHPILSLNLKGWKCLFSCWFWMINSNFFLFFILNHEQGKINIAHA